MSYYESYANEHADQQEFERLKAQRRRRDAQHEAMQPQDDEQKARQNRIASGLEAARKESSGDSVRKQSQ
jgi:hypothetical protein